MIITGLCVEWQLSVSPSVPSGVWTRDPPVVSLASLVLPLLLWFHLLIAAVVSQQWSSLRNTSSAFYRTVVTNVFDASIGTRPKC